jgi:hypothetical protein
MGIPLVVSRKFSASGFMKEATESGATLFQYIGELGRYLVTAPPGPYDRKHKIRGGLGNGMRSDIWTGFKERFGIPHLYEFYGAFSREICHAAGPNLTRFVFKGATDGYVYFILSFFYRALLTRSLATLFLLPATSSSSKTRVPTPHPNPSAHAASLAPSLTKWPAPTVS